MNTELLLKVKSAILAEPRKFNMGQWGNKDESSPCGTSACIAGHAVAIDRGMKKLNELLGMEDVIEKEASALLSLTYAQTDALFYQMYWPEQFATAYEDEMDNKSHLGMAKAAAARIDFFIATNGTDQESVPAV